MYNSMAGITGAYNQRSPMVVISGEGHNDRHVEDEIGFVRGITKWAAKVEAASDIPDAVHEAFSEIRTGRSGPVYLEVPHGVLAGTTDVELREPSPVIKLPPRKEIMNGISEEVSKCEKPVIIVGERLDAEASDSLRRLAEKLQAPILTSPEAKGVIAEDHPLSMGLLNMGYAPLAEWVRARDLFFIIGDVKAYSDLLTGKIVITLDTVANAKSVKNIKPIEVVGDHLTNLDELNIGLARRRAVENTGILDSIRKGRFGPSEQLEPQASFIKAIRKALPSNGILVQGMTQMGYYSRNYYPVLEPNTYLTASHATLGHTLPIALGAKIAKPDDPVLALSGDGGLLYNSQEIATAVQYGINVIIVVFNDNAYGNVLRAQKEEFDGHIIGTKLHNPDFVKLAESYGVSSVRVQEASELEAALSMAIGADTVSLIEVPVGEMERRY
jgi:acetolactate synthase-1/2/3 large subunit